MFQPVGLGSPFEIPTLAGAQSERPRKSYLKTTPQVIFVLFPFLVKYLRSIKVKARGNHREERPKKDKRLPQGVIVELSVKCIRQEKNGALRIQGRQKRKGQRHKILRSSEAQKTDSWLNLIIKYMKNVKV